MEQKKFVDIEQLRDTDIELDGMITRKRNDTEFEKNDIISITTKVDGANASFTFDKSDNQLHCFSRNQELNGEDGLNGFKKYALDLFTHKEEIIKKYSDYIFYGEWYGKVHNIKYDRDLKWIMFSVFDKTTERWLYQDEVKRFAEELGVEYVEELYYGPFISWEHCRSFGNKSKYSSEQEGVVVRNITKLDKYNNLDPSQMSEGQIQYFQNHHPWILKIVNDKYRESQFKKSKEIDPVREAEKAKATELLSQIITENRVKKNLVKLQEEGELPKELKPQMMGEIAKKLVKKIQEDCIKEEPEVVEVCKEYFTKISGSLTMTIAKKLILG